MVARLLRPSTPVCVGLCAANLCTLPLDVRRVRMGISRARAASVPVVLAAGMVFSSACDRGSASGAQRRQCERFCDALEKCDDTTDVLDCRDHCEANEVRSEAYFQARADCGETLSCNLWVGEVDSQGADTCAGGCDLNECVDRTLSKKKPTMEQTQACRSVATKLNACDSSLDADDVQDECEGALPGLSVRYVEESQSCIERLCGQIEDCLDDLADDYDTDLRLVSVDL